MPRRGGDGEEKEKGGVCVTLDFLPHFLGRGRKSGEVRKERDRHQSKRGGEKKRRGSVVGLYSSFNCSSVINETVLPIRTAIDVELTIAYMMAEC